MSEENLNAAASAHDHDHERAKLIAEIESRRAASGKKGLLPGIAMIGLWMLVLALFGVLGALNGKFPSPSANYTVLTICTMIAAGVFGMLTLRRWGWALVLGAALLASLAYLYMGLQMHIVPLFIMAALHFVFFLYLIRPEVRSRMR